MHKFLLSVVIILGITVLESHFELSNSLKDSVKVAKAYYVEDYTADFSQIPQVSSIKKLRRHNLCGKDRYNYAVYEEHRIHLKDPNFTKNNKGICPKLKDNNEKMKQPKEVYDEHLGDYINASPVDISIPGGKPSNLRFIAAMAPTQKSIPDFWQMIWDESVSVVVMLTNLKDNDYYDDDGIRYEFLVEKCTQYWPEKSNIPMVVDYPSQLQVTMAKQTTTNYGYVRTFAVMHTHKDKTRKVIQYHFTQWPDFGVPGDYNTFLEFMKDVQKESKNSSDRVLVHCSQGTGRTGTFLMAYTILHRMEANLSIYPKEIRQIVEHLRECRQGCVESQEQYYTGKVMIDLLENGQISPMARA